MMTPKNTCIYLTRACPQKCDYCRIRNSTLTSPELKPEQWVEVFKILESLGIEFNLLLGNEPLMLGDGLPTVLNSITTPYAIYTTAPEPHFSKMKDILSRLPNFSVPLDMSEEFVENKDSDIIQKSLRGWEALQWAKVQGIPDVHAMLTISKLNYKHVAEIVDMVTSQGIFIGLNMIHWDQDGKYDFFPKREEIEYLLLTEDEFNYFCNVELPKIKALFYRGKVQNMPAYFDALPKHGLKLDWHCSKPILTIDADGSMRTCGYRKGERCSTWSIFSINPITIYSYLEDWRKDCSDCPGCFWSYPFLNEQIIESGISTHDGFVERDKGVEIIKNKE